MSPDSRRCPELPPLEESAFAAKLFLLAADPDTLVFRCPGGALAVSGRNGVLCGEVQDAAERAGWLGLETLLRPSGPEGELLVLRRPGCTDAGNSPHAGIVPQNRTEYGADVPRCASTIPAKCENSSIARPRNPEPAPNLPPPVNHPPLPARETPACPEPLANAYPNGRLPLSPGSIAETVRILRASGSFEAPADSARPAFPEGVPLPPDSLRNRDAEERFYWLRSLYRRRNTAETFTLDGAAALLGNTPWGLLLEDVAVLPELRGQGRGSRLLNTLFRDCQKPAWLFCTPDRVPFYARLGFGFQGFATRKL